ncbi:eukaryotic aspartyl protease domain-containing protein [Ditylenchus destructor]|nr:eukaryotic aspartyl protease domain-containing protein [Ditylenchus destructor]
MGELEQVVVNISVGTPAQWFLVYPTLLNSDFWLINSSCSYSSADDQTQCLCPSNCNVDRTSLLYRRYYNSSASVTYKETEDDSVLNYVDGQVHGTMGEDVTWPLWIWEQR